MSERPIIFRAASVRAILRGRKTQTRRVIRRISANAHDRATFVKAANGCAFFADAIPDDPVPLPVPAPFKVEERLWVREPWRPVRNSIAYEADGERGGPWRAPFYLPRWASRLTLEVKDVRVERLNELTTEDARAEGFRTSDPVATFAGVWDELNGGRGHSWDSNPWVWVVTFTRHR